MAAGLSIVIPTYNPQERIFGRVLDAVGALDVPDGVEIECVIVDNRSEPGVAEMPCARTFLSRHRHVRLVREEKPGLTFARLAGIRATSGRAVVVFDDDNVPSREYLRTVVRCLEEMPWVGVWGAGNIDVELLDPVSERLRERARQAHNERTCQHPHYGCVPGTWQSYYPIGMGQVIRRDVAERYRAAVEGGTLNATDRTGRSFASAGDIQIVWQAINMGAAAGVHPDLRVTHLIPGSRASVAYMKRLAFGCGMSYHPALAQSFPSQQYGPSAPPPAWRDVASLASFLIRRTARGRVRFLSIDFANLLGLACGRVVVEGRGQNYWTFRLARTLGLT